MTRTVAQLERGGDSEKLREKTIREEEEVGKRPDISRHPMVGRQQSSTFLAARRVPPEMPGEQIL